MGSNSAKAFVPRCRFFVEHYIDKRASEIYERGRKTYEQGTPPECVELPPELHRWREEQRSAYREAKTWCEETAHNTESRLALLLAPDRFRSLCDAVGAAVPFSAVLCEELDEIGLSRKGRIPPGSADMKKLDATAEWRPRRNTLLSGRRSARTSSVSRSQAAALVRATFALGILEGMADRNILPYIDVLSTVSGGGYIGSWLISWIKRRGGVEAVQRSLKGNATALGREGCPHESKPTPDPYLSVPRNTEPDSDHVRPIRLLRTYARYLAPQAGLFAVDTWTIGSTWLRNTFLNLLILTAFFGAVLMLPRIAAYILVRGLFWSRHFTPRAEPPAWIAFLAAAALMLGACWLIGERDLSNFGPSLKLPPNRDNVQRGGDDIHVFGRLSIALLGAFCQIAFFWYALLAGFKSWEIWALWAFVIAVACAILGKKSSSWGRSYTGTIKFALEALCVSTVTAFVGGAFALGVYSILKTFAADTESGLWYAIGLSFPLALATNGITVVMFLGLMGNILSDEQREWWGRMGALLGIAIVVWLVVFTVCLFAPLGIAKLGVAAAGAGGVWALITYWGSKVAYSAKSGRDGGGTRDWRTSLALAMGPPVFVLGLLSLASYGVFLLVALAISRFRLLPGVIYTEVASDLLRTTGAPSAQWIVDHYWALLYAGSWMPVLVAMLLAIVAVVLASRIDINQFSMHNFYKNRLVRCYLGASRARPHRAANAFTGFDLEDDIRLARFRHSDPSQPLDMALDCRPSYSGPFPVINTALNITHGQDLGLQERKAQSFVFTPLWSGFDFSKRQAAVRCPAIEEYAYRPTKQFGDPLNWGVSLGTAMAISGAAFNANSGFHTSPPVAFLLTVFGVRLGWWAGNPRRPTWTKPSPPLGIGFLLRELTANTSTYSDFVLLSDGGHFENMGLYELVRRRCRYIIVVDAEEDEEFKLEGIGGAIRKCRVDFGVAIDLDLEALKPLGCPAVGKLSKLHYTIGRVQYPGEAECGDLVYIKSSVTGDEPVDITEFRNRHPKFPHTSTANQFFDESHFESYRALGHHIAVGVFLTDVDEGLAAADRVDMLFRGIESGWRARKESLAKEKRGGNSSDGKS